MAATGEIKQLIDQESGVGVNYRIAVTNWYDGRPLTDDLLDNDIFRKKGNLYYQKTIDPNTLLKINTVQNLRNQNGYYEGQEISLLGYYKSGDKPPLTYKFTVEGYNEYVDDGASIIKTTKGSWIAQFNNKVNLRDFGAKGDDIQDDTLYIQKCFDYADKNGLTAIIDVGVFKHTSDLNVGGGMSIDGFGQHSTLRPNSCNGLNILASNGILPREIKNFWIYGNGAEEFVGIISSITAGRATAIDFNSVGFAFIGKMFDLQSVWHSSITNCYGYQLYNGGITLRGGCVKFDVYKNTMIRSTIAVNPNDTKGITINLGNGTRPEDVNIYNNLTFGFDFGIDVETVLMVNILQNDLDYCVKEGIRVQQGDSVLNIKNNWIAQYVDQSNTKPFNGINLVALGAVNNVAKNIECNTINGSLVGGYGINVRTNQRNVNITGNTINNHTGIYAESDTIKIEDNTINSESISIFYAICSNVWTDKNRFIKGWLQALGGFHAANINFGVNNSGILSTGFRTRITLPASQTSKGGLLADLNIGDIRENPSRLYAFGEAKTRSNFNFGNVTFTVSGDSYSLNVENTNTEDTDFYCEVKCYLF